ncbi:MAG: PEP-CTERM sorting domain-containing protein [Caldimonas sp.]
MFTGFVLERVGRLINFDLSPYAVMARHSPSSEGSVMKFNKLSALVVAAGAVMALSSGVANAVETNFIGSTDGCFGLACAPPGATTLAGLTYSSSTFNVTTVLGAVSVGNAPGSPNLNNFGSFTLTGAPYNYSGNHFDLLVTFTAPPGTTPGSVLVSDLISGAVAGVDNGGVFIDFDNTAKHFTFGGGTFDLYINDIDLTAGHDVALTGRLVVTSIPEPETYALFMAGLAAVGFMSRRRRKA